MDIKQLNETLSNVLNESKDDDKNALAKFLEVDIEKLSEESNFYDLSQFTVKDKNKQTYVVSSKSNENFFIATLAERLEKFYTELNYEQFFTKIVPYYLIIKNYLKIDFKHMAQDIIKHEGIVDALSNIKGHELLASNVKEFEYDGNTYYIYKKC